MGRDHRRQPANRGPTTRPDRPAQKTALLRARLQRDADLAKQVAASVGLTANACVNAREFCHECKRGAGALLLTEEALTPATISTLLEFLNTQPPWSDLAIIICASQGAALEGRFGTIAKLRETTNLTLLERPVRSWMLASTLRAAVRARRRQYEMRDLYQERASVLERERAARKNAEEANRAMDDFVAMVSHELRTPLNAILGWTKIMRARPMADAQLARALEVIERNAESQRRLVEDLLDISRVLAQDFRLTPCAVRLGDVVESAIDAVGPTAELKSLTLECTRLDESVVFGDPDRLSQVVTNLLTNAIKFTPSGGRVSVALRREDALAVVEVADTGEGIEPAFLPYVFDRFRQADTGRTRRHGGLGLGLAISRALVELHGGTIEARSEGKGCGARLLVRIPRDLGGGTTLAPDRSLELQCPPSLRGVRVLVVDDEAEARELIEFVLTSCGLQVRTAPSAKDGLTALREWRPQTLFSDIAMPDTDGFRFLEQVRLLSQDDGGSTPAVAVTAYARAEDRQHALTLGFNAYVAKPLNFAKLLTACTACTSPVLFMAAAVTQTLAHDEHGDEVEGAGI